MKYGFSYLLVLIASAAFAQSNKWTIDKSHTNISFVTTHLTISEVEGKFKSFDGWMTASKPDFTDAQIEFTVDVNSISTDNESRDNHLKSDDFFNAEKYPQIKFRSTSMKKENDKKYVLEGDLTIRDVTKRVKFDVTYGGTAKDGYGNTHAGFRATGNINRHDFNLKWNKMVEAGAVVGDTVQMLINIQFLQPKA